MCFYLFPYSKIVLLFKSNVYLIIYLVYFPETEKKKKKVKRINESVKSIERTFKNLKKIVTDQLDGYSTLYLLDYLYFRDQLLESLDQSIELLCLVLLCA